MDFLLPALKPELIWMWYGMNRRVNEICDFYLLVLFYCLVLYYLSNIVHDALVGLKAYLKKMHCVAEQHFCVVDFATALVIGECSLITSLFQAPFRKKK